MNPFDMAFLRMAGSGGGTNPSKLVQLIAATLKMVGFGGRKEPVGHECMSLNNDEHSMAFHDMSDFASKLAFAGVDDCLELLLEHEVIPGFCTVQEALASSRASTQWVLCLMAQSKLTLGDESTEDESDPEDKEGNQ